MHEKNLKAISHSIPAAPPGHMNGGPRTQKSKSADTPLCYVLNNEGLPIGHIWQGTTSSRVQVCSRCKLVQFKSKTGHWKNARTIKSARKSLDKEAVTQGELFASLDQEEG